MTAKFNNQLPVLNYLWNSQNQLVSVDLDGDNIFDIDYLYDSRGQLIGRRDVDGVVLYLNAELDGLSQVLAEYRPDGTSIVEYQYGVERVSQTRQQETWYYHAGLLGSINRISDEQGIVSAEYRYDGFGNLLFSNASVENSFFFSGERRDVTVGLDYLRARFLDTRVGRFVSSVRSRSRLRIQPHCTGMLTHTEILLTTKIPPDYLVCLTFLLSSRYSEACGNPPVFFELSRLCENEPKGSSSWCSLFRLLHIGWHSIWWTINSQTSMGHRFRGRFPWDLM